MGRNSKWIDASPDDCTQRIAARALESRLERIGHYLDRAVREPRSETENVHQLRVFARRAAAALEIFDDWLPARRGRWVNKQVKRVRKAAGEARDLDVLRLGWIERGGQMDANQVALLLDELGRCREAAQQPIEASHEKLIGKDFERRVTKFVKHVRTRQSPCSAEDRFASMARAALARLVTPYLQAAHGEMHDAEAMHAFRIQGKQVRYAMEIFVGAFDAAFRDALYPLVASLQDKLGAINDHVTAQKYLAQWRDRAESCSLRHACEVGLEAERHFFDVSRDEFLAWWTAERQADLSNRFAPYVNPDVANR
jgi:CHAD domain-containing protein